MPVITGNLTNQTLLGSAVADTITGNGGSDVIRAGGGNDVLYGDGNVNPDNESSDGNDNDVLFGDAGDDTIFGGVGDDLLFGGIGNDRLAGNAGSDILFGGAGNDVFVAYHRASSSSDEVYDFTAGDRIDVSALGISSFETLAHLLKTTASGHVSLAWRIGGSTQDMVLVNTEIGELSAASFVFSTAPAGTVINGTASYEDLFGGLGNDRMSGLNGHDRLFGEQGNDTLYGGSLVTGSPGDGQDFLHGGAGNDLLLGGTDDDTLVGGSGADTLNGNAGANRLTGGAEADVFVFDVLTGNRSLTHQVTDFAPGVDDIDLSALNIGSFATVRALLAQDGDLATFAWTFDGKTMTIEFANLEVTQFTAGDFRLGTSLANQVLVGTSREDMIAGGRGNDQIRGNDGSDTLFGEDGNDTLLGGSITNPLSESDRLVGGAGNDLLFGDRGNDRLDGGVGNDTLTGGTGQDLMRGGAGADRFTFANGDSADNRPNADVILDFSRIQGDKIDLSAVDASLAPGKQQLVLDADSTPDAGKVSIEVGLLYTDLYLNTDTDSSIEMVIRIVGAPQIAAIDLIL